MEQAYKYNELRQHEISGITEASATSALWSDVWGFLFGLLWWLIYWSVCTHIKFLELLLYVIILYLGSLTHCYMKIWAVWYVYDHAEVMCRLLGTLKHCWSRKKLKVVPFCLNHSIHATLKYFFPFSSLNFPLNIFCNVPVCFFKWFCTVQGFFTAKNKLYIPTVQESPPSCGFLGLAYMQTCQMYHANKWTVIFL